MITFLSQVLVPTAVASVTAVFLMGFTNMVRGGSSQISQNLMQLRIAEREAIIAKAAPLRGKRDAILAKAREIEKTADPLNEQIRKAEAGLFDLHNEIATISRALKGQTA